MPRKAKRKKRKSRTISNVATTRDARDFVKRMLSKHSAAKDNVNNPSHYGSARMVNGKYIEVIDVVESFDLDHYDASAIQYILRASKKGATVQDYRKAIWYMVRKMRKQLNQIIVVDEEGKVKTA